MLYTKDSAATRTSTSSRSTSTAAVTDLTPRDRRAPTIVDALIDDPDHILVAHNQRDEEVFDVYRVNVETGDETLVAQNPGNIVELGHRPRRRGCAWRWPPTASTTPCSTARARSEPFRPILTHRLPRPGAPLFFTSDNKQFYAVSNRGRDNEARSCCSTPRSREGARRATSIPTSTSTSAA